MIAVASLTLMTSFGVNAQFRDMDSEPIQGVGKTMNVGHAAEIDHFSHNQGKLTQLGVSKGAIEKIKGFGREVKLIDALKIVVPSGWNAKKMGDVDTQQLVKFGGNGSWVEAVAGFAAETQTHITIDWDTKLLTLHGRSKPVSSHGMIKLASAEDARAAVAEVKAPVKVVPPAPKWNLVNGKSLKENIEAWAATAQYKISWQAVNYMIKADALYQGEFDDDVSGPIASIVKTFECHDVPLNATFMEDNRVLVVENATNRGLTCSKAVSSK
jgi:hypothetical protein